MEPGSLFPHSQVPATCPIPSQISPVHTATPHFLKIILIVSSRLRLGLPSGLFPSGFLTKTLCKLAPIRATCSAHLILDLIPRLIFGDQYRSLIPRYAVFFTPLLPSPP